MANLGWAWLGSSASDCRSRTWGHTAFQCFSVGQLGGSILPACHSSSSHGLARASSSHGNGKSGKEQLENCLYSYCIGQNKLHGQVQGQGTESQNHITKSMDTRGVKNWNNNTAYTNMRKCLICCFKNYSCCTYYLIAVLFENRFGSPSFNYVKD